MRVFHTDNFPIDLPAGHRFPIQKYALLREALVVMSVAVVHPAARSESQQDAAIEVADAPRSEQSDR